MIRAVAGRLRQHCGAPSRLLVTNREGCSHFPFISSSSGSRRRNYHFSSLSALAATPALAPSHNNGGGGGSSSDNNASSGNEAYGLYRLLNPDERQLLLEQRQLTETARQLVSLVNAKDKPAAKLETVGPVSFMDEFNLESTFSVVIAGEFNSGKSTLINALLGKKLLDTGALPTTDCITILALAQMAKPNNDHDDSRPNKQKNSVQHLPTGVTLHYVPDCALLEDLTLVDTPGTNAVIVDHTARTLRLLPSADLIMFVTSADRPFPDSERTLLRSIQAYRKSIVIILNKMDILDAAGGDHGVDEKTKVVDFVSDNASELLGARPIVIPVSSRDALSAKLMNKATKSLGQDDAHHQSNVWRRSNFNSLESFLKDSLTARAKLKSKLTNPIGVAEGMMEQCFEKLKVQREALVADTSTLELLTSQFDGWKKELLADLDLSRREMVDAVLLEGKRCDLLLQRSKWHEQIWWTFGGFEKFEHAWYETRANVTLSQSNNLEEDLIESAKEAADLVATRGRAQGQAVIEYLGKRPAMRNQSLVGTVTAASRFEDTRRSLLEQLSQAARSGISRDDNQERRQVFHSLRQALILSSTFHVGALGSILSTGLQILDPMSGILATISFAATGGAVHSTGTARIAKQYRNEWDKRVNKLDMALKVICNKELDRVNRKILDGIAPYTRFVTSELGRIDDLTHRCEDTKLAAISLRNRINKSL